MNTMSMLMIAHFAPVGMVFLALSKPSPESAVTGLSAPGVARLAVEAVALAVAVLVLSGTVVDPAMASVDWAGAGWTAIFGAMSVPASGLAGVVGEAGEAGVRGTVGVALAIGIGVESGEGIGVAVGSGVGMGVGVGVGMGVGVGVGMGSAAGVTGEEGVKIFAVGTAVFAAGAWVGAEGAPESGKTNLG